VAVSLAGIASRSRDCCVYHCNVVASVVHSYKVRACCTKWLRVLFGAAAAAAVLVAAAAVIVAAAAAAAGAKHVMADCHMAGVG